METDYLLICEVAGYLDNAISFVLENKHISEFAQNELLKCQYILTNTVLSIETINDCIHKVGLALNIIQLSE